MTNNQINRSEAHFNLNQVGKDQNDLQIITYLILRNWYWFALSAVVAFFFVRFYVKHTLPVYRTTTTILINETEGNRSM